eukprot:NODE_804_length_3799_cov_0.577297.p6 type:complete len:117 gc:universal NODE_804_length_3799_cov_0.577297:3032-3382(+)
MAQMINNIDNVDAELSSFCSSSFFCSVSVVLLVWVSFVNFAIFIIIEPTFSLVCFEIVFPTLPLAQIISNWPFHGNTLSSLSPVLIFLLTTTTCLPALRSAFIIKLKSCFLSFLGS